MERKQVQKETLKRELIKRIFFGISNIFYDVYLKKATRATTWHLSSHEY